MSTRRPPREVFPEVEFSEIRGHHLAGHFNLRELSAALGCVPVTAKKYIVDERLFLPDLVTSKCYFFRQDRLEEFKEKWAGRSTAFPVSGPVKGVITSFGTMMPRAKPRREVLERLMKERPKRRTRGSYSKTGKHYNLEDLF